MVGSTGCWSACSDGGAEDEVRVGMLGGGCLGGGSAGGTREAPVPKLPVRLRFFVGGSPSWPREMTANELTRVSRGEATMGLFCNTGDWDGWGRGGGARPNTGLRDALRADSLASRGVGCSPLILRLSSVAAWTSASSPPNPPVLPRAPRDATGDLVGSALSRLLNAVAEDDRGAIDVTSGWENDVEGM